MRKKNPGLHQMRYLFAGVALVMLAPALLFASVTEAESLMKQGNLFYQDKQYEKAIDAYQKVITLGYEGTSLYYNLGNAFYRDGKLGYAILYYNKAHRLSPDDGDVIHNLAIANAKTIDKIDTMPQFFLFQWWENLLTLFSVPGWTRIVYIFYVLLLASIGSYFFVRRLNLQRYSFFAGLASALILIVVGTLWIVNVNRQMNVKEAVIVDPTVAVKLSPDSTSNDAFIIHEGLKVRETNSVGDWIEIRLQDGKEGWIRQIDAGAI